MKKKPPKLSHHKHRELGYVTVDGAERYFRGRWPTGRKTPPSDVATQYEDFCAEWWADRVEQRQDGPASVPLREATIDEIWLRYKTHTEARYRKNGKPTSEALCVREACRIAAREFGELPARRFGPLKLKEVRKKYVAAGWSRDYVNKQTSRLRRMFKWAAGEELVGEPVWRALTTVEDLREVEFGRKDRERVGPISDDAVEATLPFLPANLRDLVRVHRLIGCRADEVCIMRTCDLDRSGASDLWTFTPSSSKNNARYFVGPKAIGILKRLIRPDEPEEWLFPTRNRGRGCWATASYRRAVLRAIRAATASGKTVARWSPLQIRKAAAQEARDAPGLGGIEAAQARLQHRELSTSEIYAWKLEQKAAEVARALG